MQLTFASTRRATSTRAAASSTRSFTPRIKMYSKVIRCLRLSAKYSHASSNWAKGYFLFTGMICSRTTSVAPCSETASLTCIGSSASNRICGASPLVEIVMRRAPISTPQGALRISSAGCKFLKLARGSPIPMKTRLLTRSPLSFSTRTICPTISPAVRLRLHPSRPLAQNLQP